MNSKEIRNKLDDIFILQEFYYERYKIEGNQEDWNLYSKFRTSWKVELASLSRIDALDILIDSKERLYLQYNNAFYLVDKWELVEERKQLLSKKHNADILWCC